MKGFRKSQHAQPLSAGAAHQGSLSQFFSPPDQGQSKPKGPRFALKPEVISEGHAQRGAVAWFRHYGLPLGSTLRAVPNGIWFGVGGKGSGPPTAAQKIRHRQIIDRMVAEGMLPGTPDTYTTWPAHKDPRGKLLDSPAGSAWIERKREGETYSSLSDEQRKEILDLLRSGQRVGICRTQLEEEELYLGWGVHLRTLLPRAAAPAPNSRKQVWPLEGTALRDMILRTTEPKLLRLWGHMPRLAAAAPRAEVPSRQTLSKGAKSADRQTSAGQKKGDPFAAGRLGKHRKQFNQGSPNDRTNPSASQGRTANPRTTRV